MEAAFLDELENIQKEAGIGGFISGGIKGLSRLGSSRGRQAIGRLARSQWGKGGMEGAKRLAKGQLGQMAGTAGLAGLAGYGGYRLLRGNKPQQQQTVNVQR
jgi:hypothetical protein